MHFKIFSFFIIIVAFLTSCQNIDYSSKEKWMVRDNAKPRYSLPYDIFYVGAEAYSSEMDLEEFHNFVVRELVRRCEMYARVFTPLVQTPKDVKAAFKLYMDLYHGKQPRPFAIICQGTEGKFMLDIAKSKDNKLRKAGLFYLKYSDYQDESFVTEELNAEIQEAYEDYHRKVLWGRDVKPKAAK